MDFKSSTRPKCVCCGGPIAKRTWTHWFRLAEHRGDPIDRTHVVEKYPTTRAECQAFVNEQVVSIRRYPDGDARLGSVHCFSTWDGESYVDEFFCTGTCAQSYGYKMARLAKNMAKERA